MIKYRLGERLTTRSLTNIRRKTERLVDRQIGLDGVERRARTLFFTKDVASATIENGVDTAHGCVGAEDFDEEDGFLEGGLGEEFGGVEDAAAGGDDLSTTTVDGVGVEGYVLDVETDASHGFIGQTTFLGGPARVSNNATNKRERRVYHWKAATQESLISFKY
jgi:hypothetical protein